MQLVGIAHGASDLAHGKGRELEELRGLGHAVADEVLLRRLARRLLEHLAEVAPVKAGPPGNVLDRDVRLVVLLHEVDGLADVEALDLARRLLGLARDGAKEVVEEEVGVPDEVQGRGVAV